MHTFRVTVMYGRLVFTRDIHARTLPQAMDKASERYPLAASITVE